MLAACERNAPSSWSALQILPGVVGAAVDADLEVQVRPRAVAGAADVADDLALGDVPRRDAFAAHVGVQRRHASAMVDDGAVPVTGAARDAGDGPRLDGRDGGAGGGRDVDAVVEAPATRAEGRDHGTPHWPDKPAGRHRATAVGDLGVGLEGGRELLGLLLELRLGILLGGDLGL